MMSILCYIASYQFHTASVILASNILYHIVDNFLAYVFHCIKNHYSLNRFLVFLEMKNAYQY